MRKQISTAFLFMATHCLGAGPSLAADQAFQRYITQLEAQLSRQHSSPATYFATLNGDPGSRIVREHRLLSGEILVEPVDGGMLPLGGALFHHWRAAAFVQGATPQAMLALLRDYDHLATHYAPEMISSSAVANGDEPPTLAVRLRELRILSIVLDAEYKVDSKLENQDRGYSSSRSTHIWQVDWPGTSREKRRAAGEDDGFLWHLNSYWTFARVAQGLLVECEVISLTRDIPLGLGWLATPVVEDVSRQELEFTLRSTRSALIASAREEAQR